MNIRIRYHNHVLSHVIQIRSKLLQNFQLFSWGINVMVWSWEFCVQIYKPEFIDGTFILKSPNVLGDFWYLSITERFTVYNLVVLYIWPYVTSILYNIVFLFLGATKNIHYYCSNNVCCMLPCYPCSYREVFRSKFLHWFNILKFNIVVPIRGEVLDILTNFKTFKTLKFADVAIQKN